MLFEYKYDLVLVNESWLKEGEEFQLENQQYGIVRSDDPEGYRGVATIYRKGLIVFSGEQVLPRDLLFPNILLTKVLVGGGRGNGQHLFILNFYCPPTLSCTRKVLKNIDCVLAYLSQKYKQWSLIAYSDINLDIRSPTGCWKDTKKGEVINELITKYELIVTVPNGKGFTWHRGKAKTGFLDFFLRKNVKEVISSEILDQTLGSSDHFPITLKIKSACVSPLLLDSQWSISKTRLQTLMDKVAIPQIEEFINKESGESSTLTQLFSIIRTLRSSYQPITSTKFCSTFAFSGLVGKLIEGEVLNGAASQIIATQSRLRHEEMI